MNPSSPGWNAPALRPSVRILSVLFLTAVLVAGCRDGDVVAEVGSTELRAADLREFTSRRAPDSGGTDAHLDALIARARLAEHAVSLELDERPDIQARLEAARREVLAQAVLEERLKGVMDEKGLRERYEATKQSLERRQVHVRHVMVRLAEGADEAERRRARDRASLLYARIAGGEAFEVVAKEASQDEGSAQRGGDLGVVKEGQVDPAFFEVAAALKKDELSKPFETPYGMHVAQALAPVETVVPAFEEARGRLAAEARREAEAKLVKELEGRIPAERFPEALAPEAVATKGDEG